MVNFRVIPPTFHGDFEADLQILPKTIKGKEVRLHFELFERVIHKLKDQTAVLKIGLAQVIQEFLVLM